MNDRLTIALNPGNRAPSQYTNMPFDSVVEFNGKLVMFGVGGVFEEGGQTDDGATISAWIDLPLHDFGHREQKSIEAFDVGYEASDDLVFTLTGDEKTANARVLVLPPPKLGQVQQDGMRTLKKHKYGKARYWGVRVANTVGCDFSVDYIALAPVILSRRAG